MLELQKRLVMGNRYPNMTNAPKVQKVIKNWLKRFKNELRKAGIDGEEANRTRQRL
jgi:predicted GIY-YIG superfamily endonuclease